MPQRPVKYSVYLLLYTIFWNAIAVILYRAFFLNGQWGMQAGMYFFLVGLILLVCGVYRSLHSSRHGETHGRDPIRASFALAGLLMILYANLV